MQWACVGEGLPMEYRRKDIARPDDGLSLVFSF